jgi:AcrR family transcriptional regulator
VSHPVNRRTYDSAGRRARSAETRARVLVAAGELFVSNGYGATTVADIAARSEVHVDTVYRLVGRKAAILRELIEASLSGTGTTVVAERRDYVESFVAEPDPTRKLAIYASAVRQIHSRLAPLFRALTEAAASEPEAAKIWSATSRRRAANMRKLVADLEAAGGLRSGLSPEDAADTVWATNSPEVYVLMVEERGWSPDAYEAWLLELWCRYLLPDPPPPTRSDPRS